MRGKRSEVVLDIETLAYPPESFEPGERGRILGAHPTEEEAAEAKLRLRLAPLTARLIAVAMFNPQSGLGKVWYEHPGGEPGRTPDGSIGLVPADEETMLAEFWSAVKTFQRIITFNGRTFDCPFMMLRSALLGISPSRNLLPYRFSHRDHCDLLDQLTFYGATRKFPLESYCRGFGIPLPGRAEGRPDFTLLAGQGRHRDIAEYAARTVRATAELYSRWETFLSCIGEGKPD